MNQVYNGTIPYTLEINGVDYDCTLGFTWYEGEDPVLTGPMDYRYPGTPDEIELYDLIYTDLAGKKVDLSWLIDDLQHFMYAAVRVYLNNKVWNEEPDYV